MGCRLARRGARADRPGHAVGDGHHPRGPVTSRGCRRRAGRCGSQTAATAPSPASTRAPTSRISTIAVGSSPQAITIADGKAWVTVDEQSIAPTESRPTAGRCGSFPVRRDSMDPALAGELSLQLLYATCAQLLNYPDKAGPAGSQLTPEVARSLPDPLAPTAGPTRSRSVRGFRFSPPSNEPVTAQTFKDTIERTLNPAMQSDYAALSDRYRRRGRVHVREGQPHRRHDRPRRHA